MWASAAQRGLVGLAYTQGRVARQANGKPATNAGLGLGASSSAKNDSGVGGQLHLNNLKVGGGEKGGDRYHKKTGHNGVLQQPRASPMNSSGFFDTGFASFTSSSTTEFACEEDGPRRQVLVRSNLGRSGVSGTTESRAAVREVPVEECASGRSSKNERLAQAVLTSFPLVEGGEQGVQEGVTYDRVGEAPGEGVRRRPGSEDSGGADNGNSSTTSEKNGMDQDVRMHRGTIMSPDEVRESLINDTTA